MRQAFSAVVDQVTGLRETGRFQIERALPVGTPLTAIGELAFVSEALGGCTGAVRRAGQVGFNTHLVCHGAEGQFFYGLNEWERLYRASEGKGVVWRNISET